jgi:hypothetical protein
MLVSDEADCLQCGGKGGTEGGAGLCTQPADQSRTTGGARKPSTCSGRMGQVTSQNRQVLKLVLQLVCLNWGTG